MLSPYCHRALRQPGRFFITVTFSGPLWSSCCSAGGPTLALGDFSRAVDLRAFPRDVAFTGTSYTSSFECEQMKRNEPWKYQVLP